MAFVRYSNGIVCEWDENLCVGALIKTYNEGFHVLTRIEFRENPNVPNRLLGLSTPALVEQSHPDMSYPPLFHYHKVLKADGTKSKALKGSCDASFCSAVTLSTAAQEERQELAKIAQKYEAIRSFL